MCVQYAASGDSATAPSRDERCDEAATRVDGASQPRSHEKVHHEDADAETHAQIPRRCRGIPPVSRVGPDDKQLMSEAREAVS